MRVCILYCVRVCVCVCVCLDVCGCVQMCVDVCGQVGYVHTAHTVYPEILATFLIWWFGVQDQNRQI